MHPLLQAVAEGSRFMPHGMCYLWEPELLWLHVVSDVLTGTAYFAIPPALLVLVIRARREVPQGAAYMARGLPLEWMFVAFSLFIVACGTTHFFGAWNVWHTDYWLAGGAKVVTAAASLGTALALPPLIPRALQLVRDARESEVRRIQLEHANEELRRVRDMLQVELESASVDIEAMATEVTRRRQEMERALEEARTARDEASAASQAKSDFLAVMSHELRTPLNAIIGYADLLDLGVKGALNDGQRVHLDRIRIGARHLLRIIDDILVFARSEAGATALERDPVKVPQLLDEVVGLLRPEAADKGIGLTLDADGATVITDRERLLRVVTNLVSNAVKFTDEGEVAVRAAVDEAHTLRITVTDTGPGIGPEDRERVFDPFWQVDQSSTRRTGGTGLGLSIARRLAREMGGDVSLTSTPGEGSRFTLVVPVEPVERGEPGRGGEPGAPTGAA